MSNISNIPKLLQPPVFIPPEFKKKEKESKLQILNLRLKKSNSNMNSIWECIIILLNLP